MSLDMMFTIQQFPLNLFDHYLAYWEIFYGQPPGWRSMLKITGLQRNGYYVEKDLDKSLEEVELKRHGD